MPAFAPPRPVSIDSLGIAERVERFRARSYKSATKLDALRLAVTLIDLTTLEGADTPGKVRQLCARARAPFATRPDLAIPPVAAVCVYQPFVTLARQCLEGSPVRLASVSTAFPSGHAPLALRLEETRYAVADGADEIDMVISRNAFLRGDLALVADEISQVKSACGAAHLKVILETGEIGTLENVRLASDLAISAGADFIKTSTGKISPAATPEVTLVMLQAIRDYFHRTGQRIGMKPAGGIRDTKTALLHLTMIRETLGPAWLSPELYRFGASALLNDLLLQILKQTEGHYQNPDVLSVE